LTETAACSPVLFPERVVFVIVTSVCLNAPAMPAGAAVVAYSGIRKCSVDVEILHREPELVELLFEMMQLSIVK
jgi:hypothetical protein